MTESVAGTADTAGGFRTMMAGFPTGVAVVASTDPAGRPWGMTCSSLCSVSMTPPALLVSLREGSPTLSAVIERGRFTVNLLHERARTTAELFASGRRERFDLVDWDVGTAGPHLTADSHAIADCRVTAAHPVADHVVVYGEVDDVLGVRDGRPLLYGMRRYGRWDDIG
ncbi:flavin reductase family protein [Prauserella alba]|uniref:Flavin reductase family protein n=1 Tax=Prauserella alba TaxID=176898 RepID=A0ABP4GD49_9PSEU|nr:flavin reductase family protein [Prauserella alba]MCP2180810.1 NADH-FMN oxidoreductase RutF, flavin reductase (DIM6/NTAB) family [Prauserella alba]